MSFRIAWRETETSREYHTEETLESRDAAQTLVDHLNVKFAGRLEHWVEQVGQVESVVPRG